MLSKDNLSQLLKAYKEQKKDENLFLDTQSIHWENYFKKNDKFCNLDNLINFRKNQLLSKGLDDAAILQNSFNLIEALKYFKGDFLKKNLPEKNVGNCEYSINFLGHYFDYGIIHHLKWYEEVEKYIQKNSLILEIGGGFGSFSRIVLNNRNVKYFLVDLPEANLMCNYYLQSHFPEKKIFNYSNLKENKLNECLNNYDVFILPPRILEKEDIKFDFIINSRSFMEMNKKIIKEYFDLIQNKINQNGYFLNINRYLKSTVNEDIKFDEYPYDNYWNVEISKKSFLQSGVHFLLTKRHNVAGNINDELLMIKKTAKKLKYPGTNILNSFKSSIKKFAWLIIKSTLSFLFSKNILKKISKVIYNISEL